ncbi:hypothetical protein FKW77_009048 [Venturia effusa]|uniref:Uncharacterized protein n=1 Tax=Venturia effusa TaxID=50376 RepID=A0A517L801_9PEZI|nr:hypothetical protein FKW77_009048 [Venturia effusa]
MTESLATSGSLGCEAEDNNNNNARSQTTTTRPPVPTNNRSTGTLSGTLSGTHSLAASRSPSIAASPRSSRDSSPAGRPFRQQNTSGAAPSGMRSRKDSHDVSPNRPANITAHSGTVPSAAAIQRALSAATTPQLPTALTSDPSSTTTTPSASKLPRVSRVQPATPGSGENTPSWPPSPRLKSPPPSSSRRNSFRTQRKPEISTTTPNIVVQTSTPTSTPSITFPKQAETPEEPDARAGASAGKAPSRGASGAPTLETVQEFSAPTTPDDASANGIRYEAGPSLSSSETSPWSSHSNTDPHNSAESPFNDAQSEDDHAGTSGATTPRKEKANVSKGDSGSDAGVEKKSDRQNKDAEEQDPDTTPRAKAVASRSSLNSLRPKAEASAKNMTVETETISSIPQGTLGPPTDRIASGRIESVGTLRTKASSDTIRPNKGRKKASRKAPSINNTGMYSSSVPVFIQIGSGA